MYGGHSASARKRLLALEGQDHEAVALGSVVRSFIQRASTYGTGLNKYGEMQFAPVYRKDPDWLGQLPVKATKANMAILFPTYAHPEGRESLK
jgi:hypothetical protein